MPDVLTLDQAEDLHRRIVAALDAFRFPLTAAGRSDRRRADRDLDGLRRHTRDLGGECTRCFWESWPCDDALAWSADLLDLAAAYGVEL